MFYSSKYSHSQRQLELRKHLLNKLENVLLPDSWTNAFNGHKDTFLITVLLPWFQQLHASRSIGLKSFRADPKWRIGGLMLCKERGRREYNELMELLLGPVVLS